MKFDHACMMALSPACLSDDKLPQRQYAGNYGQSFSEIEACLARLTAEKPSRLYACDLAR
jgi:hypothetical protein